MRNTQWPLTEYEVEFLLFKPVPAYPPNSSAPKHTHKLKCCPQCHFPHMSFELYCTILHSLVIFRNTYHVEAELTVLNCAILGQKWPETTRKGVSLGVFQ